MDLTELYPFSSFCVPFGASVNEADYSSISYYLTAEDLDNETNAILNSEAFVLTNPQTIHYRVNTIDTNAVINRLDASVNLKLSSLSQDLSIEVCDDDNDESATFDLTVIEGNLFCAEAPSSYNVSYYESQNDASASNNPIVNPFVYESYSRTVYVRVDNLDTGDFETAKLSLVVSEVSIGNIGAVFMCDDNNDGFVGFDLSVVDAQALFNGNTDDEVFYYEDEDLNIPIDKSVLYTNISNPQQIYIKVENELGCSATSSFTINVVNIPIVEDPEPVIVCDDDNDGYAVFDLLSKTNEILTTEEGVQNWQLNYFEKKDDPLNWIEDYRNYYSNSKTIYVRLLNASGCVYITSLDLIVQDCSTKGVIEINAFYDENQNSTFDTDEINFLNGVLSYEKNNDGQVHYLYSSNGVFNIISDDENDTYDISYTIDSEFDSCYSLTTSTFEDISVAVGNTVNYDFPVTKIIECSDIAVYLVSNAPPRPGFDYINYLVVKNKVINTVSSGTVEFIMDSNLTLNGVFGVDSGNSITNTATGFNLNFVNLPPNGYERIAIDTNVPVPTPLGTILTNSATYSVTDLNSENNTSSLSEVVIGSYDPNDILESHGPEIVHSEFTSDDYLYYTIRFQNVGTADAINVSIDNTLNADLDASTIQMLSSSHTNVFTRTGSQLNWQFDNIHLPSEDMDEPNSHGYVYYKIKPKAGYAVGDIIPNTAEIYFDFNDPVITNTFETEFITTLSNEVYNGVGFSMYPNPAKDIVWLQFNQNLSAADIEIYNIQGKMVLSTTKEDTGNFMSIDISNLSKGFYFLAVKDGFAEITKKLIVQ
ncbi:T9SS type A sorting domain-containing protein [Hyunsoonleella rubra]|uniref:T9SS type A sorting domain-containing protein n=1 Tax=Hyunsoonleella rubra TaxID=1737062 RepID=A0ABW5TGZ2_9FLAO